MKPILFNTEMVQAILEKRKTQTRRVVKPQPDDGGLHNHTAFPMSIQSTLEGWWGTVFETGESRRFRPPHGEPGGILWVRETWGWDWEIDRSAKFYYHKAGLPAGGWVNEEKWKPSIFMPLEACRLFLKVTNVRIERLQDISEDDAKAEGVKPFPLDLEGDCWTDGKYKTAFQFLWNTINGWSPNSWELNPWVWVYDFEQTEKPET